MRFAYMQQPHICYDLLFSISLLSLAALFLYSSLSRSESCDRYSEWRAGYIVKTYLVAEMYGCRISAVLAADTQLDVRSCLFAAFNSNLNELSNACLVERLERIGLEYALGNVFLDDSASIVS